MTSAGPTIEYRSLRAPARHGEALISPAWEKVGEAIAANEKLRDLRTAWLPLAEEARQSLIEQAVAHSSNYLLPDEIPWLQNVATNYRFRDRLILTGHQPQLYHPGVWFKNFACSAVAQSPAARGTLAVNLLVDNDTLRAPSITVPTGTFTAPRGEAILFDDPMAEVPFEERRILNRDLFDSFGERVCNVIAPLIVSPLMEELWPLAVAASAQQPNLGAAMSAARHILETRLGLQTLEVPLSTLCDARPFLQFLLILLRDAARLRDVYNATLAEYRKVHRIRSRSHPVPNLAVDGDWLEVPFWIWTTANPRRQRLFVRRTASGLELSDLAGAGVSVDLSNDGGNNERAIEQLRAARQRGIKLRPRALVTTMYARLLLSDLFIHGIGGAKYDQLTDAIIERFLGVTPPQFLTTTATLHLPIAHPTTTAADVTRVTQQIRECSFHPEKILAASLSLPTERSTITSHAATLCEEKQRWLAHTEPFGSNHERHFALTRINADLQPHVQDARQQLVALRERLAREAAAHALLGSREFSFCLFPKENLCRALLELCSGHP